MKKIFFLILFCLLSLFCYAIDLNTDTISSCIEDQVWQNELSLKNPVYEKFYEKIRLYKRNDEELRVCEYYFTDSDLKDSPEITVKGQINYLYDIKLNKNGFLSFTFDQKEYYFIPHIQKSDIIPIDYLPTSLDFEKQKEYVAKRRLYSDILEPKASSFLIEKNKNGICEYSPNNIEDYFPNKGIVLPWVEGVKGYGISEFIEFDVISGSTLYILNGYVDPAHPDLFKKNGRLKRAKIQVLFASGNEEISYIDFLDFVYYKTVKYKERIKHVRITIQEVYPGEKYEDTCITRILTNDSF